MYRSELKKDLPVSRTAGDRDTTSQPQLPQAKSEGWDPFEVWRDRIKEPRELSGRSSRPQLPRKRQKS